MTLLAEATLAEIHAELERRRKDVRDTERVRDAVWNEKNAKALLRVMTHNPVPFKERAPNGKLIKRTCTDTHPRETSVAYICARCEMLRMVATEDWSGYQFDTKVFEALLQMPRRWPGEMPALRVGSIDQTQAKSSPEITAEMEALGGQLWGQPDQADSFQDYCVSERKRIEAEWAQEVEGRRVAHEKWLAEGGLHNGG